MGRKRAGQRARAWCFTLHNFVPSDILHLRGLTRGDRPPAKYLVFGREYGGETHRRHLQGYVYFRNARAMGGVKKCLGNQAVHVEAAKGSVDDNRAYCTKDGDYEEHGERPSQGRRGDLDRIRGQIEDGVDEVSIARDHWNQWVVYRRSFEAYRRLIQASPVTRPDLRVYCLWGNAGVGKTRYVYDKWHDVWANSAPDLKWFDGYQGQEVALLDDFRGAADFGWLLRVLDIYPLQVPIKGGFVQWCPKIIVLTSNLPPAQWYCMEGDLQPLLRRIHVTVHVTDGDWEENREYIESKIAPPTPEGEYE